MIMNYVCIGTALIAMLIVGLAGNTALVCVNGFIILMNVGFIINEKL